MTYNEWRDELKSNLLCVSEAERRRVLDYYAEAYADRRDAGYSEREIIEDFGAPYDAAQRILSESAGDCEEPGRRPREDRRRKKDDEYYRKDEYYDEPRRKKRHDDVFGDDYYAEPPRRTDGEPRRESKPVKARGDYTWIFVLLCIVLAVPLFGLIMSMIGITVGLCAAPFGVLIGGVATIGAGIGTLFSDAANGAVTIGIGLILFGASLIIMPLCFKLVKLMWKLFTTVMGAIKGIFSGKEKF